MITLGLDPHPGSHTVVALDRNGSLLGDVTVPNTAIGLCELHRFAAQFTSRRWAIEGAGNRFIASFVADLLVQGEAVYSIAPSLTSRAITARVLQRLVAGRHQQSAAYGTYRIYRALS